MDFPYRNAILGVSIFKHTHIIIYYSYTTASFFLVISCFSSWIHVLVCEGNSQFGFDNEYVKHQGYNKDDHPNTMLI